MENLIKPKEPNFNIILAKIIEQEPLALTWALVNQKWRRKTGNFLQRRNKKQKRSRKLSTILKLNKEKLEKFR